MNDPKDFLTKEEKNIIKSHETLSIKVNEINKRINKSFRLYNKEQKRKRQIQERKRIEYIKKQEKLEKIKNFPNEYIQLKRKIYETLFEKNEKKLKEIRKDFIEKCIHPLIFKGRSYYIEYYDSGGGQGPGTEGKRECDMCKLCGDLRIKEFTDFELNDIKDNINRISIH